MNNKLLIVLFTLLWTGINAQNWENDHYCTRIPGKISDSKKDITQIVPSLFTENYDLKYYRYDWYIDPAVWYIQGTVTTYFEIIGKDQHSISFDFTNNLEVDSIVWRGKKIDFKQSDSYRLDVNFPQALAENALDSISITYHGEPPTSGFGSFIQDQHGGVPILWTLSEPFGAQDWWPCKNGLDDKIDSIDVLVTTPDKYRAASNGLLIREFISSEGNKTYHWRHRHAISPYLVAIAVTNYEVYSHDVHLSDGTTMPMLNYVYPESINQAKIGTSYNVKVLEYFDSLFVNYPFRNEKYGHAQFNWGGGMEHQTMSFVVNFGNSLLSHELAHQWFGDYVTCRTWQDIWLNEGFATYLDGLIRERFPTYPNDWYNWKYGIINSATSQPGGSVKVTNPTNVNSIFNSRLSYNKASYLVHMLRWKLGDTDFYQGIRNYLNEHQYSNTTTNDLKNSLENVSGQDLTSFFKNWYEGEGYPTYNVTWAYKDKKLIIHLNQTTSHPSVTFFDMPVQIGLSSKVQQKYIRLENTENNQTFEITTDFDVENIQFDPALWLLSKSSVKYDAGLLTSSVSDYKNDVTILPNPVQDVLTLITDKGNWDSYHIISLDGKTVQSGKCQDKETRIQVGTIHSGQYLLQLNSSKNTSKIFKWIKL